MNQDQIKEYYKEHRKEINYLFEFRAMGHANVFMAASDLRTLYHVSNNDAKKIIMTWTENFSEFEKLHKSYIS